MKRIALSAALAVLLAAGVTAPSSFAAAKKIGSTKSGAEGTASHEMSESSETQENEGTKVSNKLTVKKTPAKKSTKKSTAKK